MDRQFSIHIRFTGEIHCGYENPSYGQQDSRNSGYWKIDQFHQVQFCLKFKLMLARCFSSVIQGIGGTFAEKGLYLVAQLFECFHILLNQNINHSWLSAGISFIVTFFTGQANSCVVNIVTLLGGRFEPYFITSMQFFHNQLVPIPITQILTQNLDAQLQVKYTFTASDLCKGPQIPKTDISIHTGIHFQSQHVAITNTSIPFHLEFTAEYLCLSLQTGGFSSNESRIAAPH